MKRKAQKAIDKIEKKIKRLHEEIAEITNDNDSQEISSDGSEDEESYDEIEQENKKVDENSEQKKDKDNSKIDLKDDRSNGADQDKNERQGLINALGPHPDTYQPISAPLDPEIVDRWSAWIRNGINADEIDFLATQYITPDFLKTPKLNDEVTSLLKGGGRIREDRLLEIQELCAASLVNLGAASTLFMQKDEEIKKETILEMLNEVAKLNIFVFFEQTEARKSFIVNNIRDTETQRLLREQTTDAFLFGTDLGDRYTKLKGAQKIGSELATNSEQNKQSDTKKFLTLRANNPKRQHFFHNPYFHPMRGRGGMFYRGRARSSWFYQQPQQSNQGAHRGKRNKSK